MIESILVYIFPIFSDKIIKVFANIDICPVGSYLIISIFDWLIFNNWSINIDVLNCTLKWSYFVWGKVSRVTFAAHWLSKVQTRLEVMHCGMLFCECIKSLKPTRRTQTWQTLMIIWTFQIRAPEQD